MGRCTHAAEEPACLREHGQLGRTGVSATCRLDEIDETDETTTSA